MADNFNVTHLGEFIKEVSSTIISEAYFGKNYITYFDVMTGLKGKQKLNYFENNMDLVADTCAWTGGGNEIVFTQREIDVVAVKSEQELCIRTLERKWLGQLLKKGSNYQEFPFEEMITSDMKKQLAKMNEGLLFLGDTTGVTSTYLDLADGIVKILKGETTKVNLSGVTTISGDTTITNVEDKINYICRSFPTAIKDKNLVIFTSIANYLLYVEYLYKSNLFHYKGEVSQTFEVVVPFYPNCKVVAVEAITANSYIATVENNFVMAVDAPEELTAIDSNYDWKSDSLLTRARYKIGVQVYRPDYVVTLGV